MKLMLSLILICVGVSGYSQKLDISSLLVILNEPFQKADSIIRSKDFNLADKETGQGYFNFYYNSFEKAEKNVQILRAFSIMDIFNETDTSRMMLYRTYLKKDQEELANQLRKNGFEIDQRSGNNYIYKKGELIITNKINEKMTANGQRVFAYEFELGR